MKQAVILIHGMWSTADTLSDLAKVFRKQQYDVHLPTLPGHLPKSKMCAAEQGHLKEQSLKDYVDAIVNYVKKQDFTIAPLLVGHSMGGLIAQLVAQQITCSALIAISSAPPAGINAWSWSVLRTFGSNLFKFPLWKRITELKLKNIAYGIANSQSGKVHQSIFDNATYESGKASFEIGMWFLFVNPPSRVEASKITCPVLVLGGTEDKITPYKVQQKIAGMYGDSCTLRALHGACHWTIADGNLSLTEREIINWLEHMNLQEINEV